MKILILNYEIPYPVNSGHRMRTWNFIKTLASEHELSILCFNKSGNNESSELAKKYFKNIFLIDSNNVFDQKREIGKFERLINFFSGIPWEISKVYSEKFEKEFLRIINENNFDIILARYIVLGQYLFRNRKKIRAKTIVDLDDIEVRKSKRLMDAEGYVNIYDRTRKLCNCMLLGAYHKNLKMIDKCIVCSWEDRNYIKREKWSNNIYVLPNSIDVFKYDEISDFNTEAFSEKIILYCGSLGYDPNIDGIKWFIRDVFSLIKKKEPSIKLHIVGSNPSADIYNYADGKNVFVFPNVPTVVPCYQKASLVVVPIRSGGGTRIKILEALAARRPIVSTTVGAEGLELKNNENCIIEDDPNKFAAGCIKLLGDFKFSHTLTINGYRFVKENYDMRIADELIKDIFSNAKN